MRVFVDYPISSITLLAVGALIGIVAQYFDGEGKIKDLAEQLAKAKADKPKHGPRGRFVSSK